VQGRDTPFLIRTKIDHIVEGHYPQRNRLHARRLRAWGGPTSLQSSESGLGPLGQPKARTRCLDGHFKTPRQSFTFHGFQIILIRIERLQRSHESHSYTIPSNYKAVPEGGLTRKANPCKVRRLSTEVTLWGSEKGPEKTQKL